LLFLFVFIFLITGLYQLFLCVQLIGFFIGINKYIIIIIAIITIIIIIIIIIKQ